jgi:hypothetical protein
MDKMKKTNLAAETVNKYVKCYFRVQIEKARAMNRHYIFCLLHPEREFSEALAIERKNFTNDGCTIQVRQQIHREKGSVLSDVQVNM